MKLVVTSAAGFQPGDVPRTLVETDALTENIGSRPSSSIGLRRRRFVLWHREFFNVR